MKIACWAFLALMSATQVQAQMLDIHVLAGKQMLASGANAAPSVVAKLITAWKGDGGWRLVPHPVDDLPQAQKTLIALNAMQPDPTQKALVIAVLSARLLYIAGGEQTLAMVGANQPFPDIAEELKGRARVQRDRVLWVAIGWVNWNDFDAIRPPGGCAPGFTWQRCLVQSGPDGFVISQRACHPGWPLYGAAVVKTPANSAPDADGFMDFVASARASEALRDDFVIVPHPDVRRRRSVIFQIFGTGDGPALAQARDAPDPLPRPQVDPVTGTFNACGGANTCANYLPPMGSAANFHEQVSAALR